MDVSFARSICERKNQIEDETIGILFKDGIGKLKEGRRKPDFAKKPFVSSYGIPMWLKNQWKMIKIMTKIARNDFYYL